MKWGGGPLGFYMGVICKCDICSQTLNMLNCHKTYTYEILKSWNVNMHPSYVPALWWTSSPTHGGQALVDA